jgi:hypothetical protein
MVVWEIPCESRSLPGIIQKASPIRAGLFSFCRSDSHALIGSATALLSLRENRTVAAPGLPGIKWKTPGSQEPGVFYFTYSLSDLRRSRATPLRLRFFQLR